MTEFVRDEIQAAIESLLLCDSDIRQLSDEDARKVFDAALSHFVAGGNRRWWWEDFRFPSTAVRFTDQYGFKRIEKVVPDTKQKVWFVAEDVQLPFYPVYEASPEAIQSIVGGCYGFEYYIVAKDMSWLVCETHHDVMIAIGAEVEDRLRQLGV